MYKNNLWRAFLALYGSHSIINFLLNIDRFGNALTGGHYRTTISARVGRFQLKSSNRYWAVLAKIIDWTFEPIEGPRHCYRAFVFEGDKLYRRSSDVALALLGILVIAACLLIAPLIKVYSFFGESNGTT